jgi:sodium transport system permease protein
MTASFATAILAIISMTITLSQGSAMLPESSESAIDFALTLPVVIELLILMIPLTMMFSALLMALALFARSYREAQSYISPLMILVIVPAMVSYLPGIEPDFDLALIPVVNVALMLKTTMTGDFDVGLVAVTFLASLVYASGAIWVAFRQFQRESVLFRV